jgi:hypothetical protein
MDNKTGVQIPSLYTLILCFPQTDLSKKNFFITAFLSIFAAYIRWPIRQKERLAQRLWEGWNYIPFDFKDVFYKIILILLEDL